MGYLNSQSTTRCLFATFSVSIWVLCIAGPLFGQELAKPDISWENGRVVISFAERDFPKLQAQLQSHSLNQMVSVCLSNNPNTRLLGKLILDDKNQSIQFAPRFTLDPGTKLHIAIGTGEKVTKHPLLIPGPRNTEPKITTVYPTADKLPSNLLKFYVHFSVPMQQGNVYRHLTIMETKTGKLVELPFLELEQELWSSDRKRLTLFFDPGRIKRGLKPREEMGPIFLEGREYEFRISGKWKSESGVELGSDYIKRMSMVSEDNSVPRMNKWVIKKPNVQTTQPLIVVFDKMLDSATLERSLELVRNGKKIELAEIRLSNNEKQAELFPRQTWQPGIFRLRAGKDLEDLCGNRLGKPFDVDLDESQIPHQIKSELEFELATKLKGNSP